MIRLGVQSSIASKYSSWEKENNALSGSCLFFFWAWKKCSGSLDRFLLLSIVMFNRKKMTLNI